MTHTLPITKAREELPTLVNNAKNRLDEYVITVNGYPAAVLMSIDEYESLQETMDIMSNPGLMKAIKEGEEDIAAGRVYDWEDVKKELGWDLGLHVSDKNLKKSKK